MTTREQARQYHELAREAFMHSRVAARTGETTSAQIARAQECADQIICGRLFARDDYYTIPCRNCDQLVQAGRECSYCGAMTPCREVTP